MAVPTLTALEEERKQAQAADEELQVLVFLSAFCATAHRLQFLRERERRTLLRERARAEKEEGDDDEDDDYEDDDEEEEDEDEDVDEPGFSCGGDSRELREMASAGALLRQALKSASRKESEFTSGKYLHEMFRTSRKVLLRFAALARAGRHLPNAAEVGPVELSSMAAAAGQQRSVKIAAKSSASQAALPRTSKKSEVCIAAPHDEDDDSSWGDGSSTEEVRFRKALISPDSIEWKHS
jgi:hypothetical protein